MRTFIAIRLSSEAQQEIAAVEDQFRGIFRGSKVTWVDPAIAHLTLLFLGELSAEQLQALVGAIHELPPREIHEFPLRLTVPNCFQNPQRPQVLVVDTTFPPELEQLRQRITDAARALGLPFDQKDFHPHITIGRVKVAAETCILNKISVQPVSFGVKSFDLMTSALGDDGPKYQVIESFAI